MLFLPPATPRRAALIAPALGVRARFYVPFAEFLASEGVAACIAEPRGASLTEWAARDLPEALASLPAVPRVWIGHSMGGQLFGLVRNPDVARVLLVAAQHGHWRNWPTPARYGMAVLWWAAIPIVARARGEVPLPGGARVPGAIARQWARWGRSRSYLLQEVTPGCGFETYHGPLRAYAIDGDRYAPMSTVRPLAEAFRNAQVEVRRAPPYGHFGVFRPAARPLWEEWLAWITE